MCGSRRHPFQTPSQASDVSKDCGLFQLSGEAATCLTIDQGIIICFLNLFKRITGSSHSRKVFPGVFVAPSCKRSRKTFLRFRISAQQLTATLESHRWTYTWITWPGFLLFPSSIAAILPIFLSIPDRPISDKNSSCSFSRAFVDTNMQALCNAFISVREIHWATKHTVPSMRGLLFVTLQPLPQLCRFLFFAPAHSPGCGLYVFQVFFEVLSALH